MLRSFDTEKTVEKPWIFPKSSTSTSTFVDYYNIYIYYNIMWIFTIYTMVGQTHIYGSSYLREFTDFTVGKILVKYGDTMVGEFWNKLVSNGLFMCYTGVSSSSSRIIVFISHHHTFDRPWQCSRWLVNIVPITAIYMGLWWIYVNMMWNIVELYNDTYIYTYCIVSWVVLPTCMHGWASVTMS